MAEWLRLLDHYITILYSNFCLIALSTKIQNVSLSFFLFMYTTMPIEKVFYVHYTTPEFFMNKSQHPSFSCKPSTVCKRFIPEVSIANHPQVKTLDHSATLTSWNKLIRAKLSISGSIPGPVNHRRHLSG